MKSMELNRSERKKLDNHQIGMLMIFVAYVILTVYFLLFAQEMGRNVTSETYNYNLVLFKEISRFWKYRATLGMSAVILNIFGNVLCLVPMGILLPIVFKKCRNIIFTVFFVFLFSLTMEIIQLLTRVGSFDVDDLFLNTVGGLVGFLMFLIFSKFMQKKEKKNGT